MDITFKVKTVFRDKELLACVEEATLQRYMKAGLLVEREAKRSMRKGGGKGHEPSEPGQPPHVQSGTLRGSITTARDEKRNSVVVGPTEIAWYGRLHEYGGTFTGRKRTVTFPERPFMRPALQKAMSQFPDLMKDLPLSTTPTGQKLNMEKE